MKTIVVAIGGNSIIKNEKHMTVPHQYEAICETAYHIADLIEENYKVIITHGNGPQVGFILLRSEYSRGILHEVPLDSIGADTQGALGYQIQKALRNEFKNRNLDKEVVSVVTQTLVDKNDPAFKNPTKPIGPFYTYQQAKERMEKENWQMVEDAGRGWRRVVPSPKPITIIEKNIIKNLVQSGIVVIACGGGGIPVYIENNQLIGLEAVIDKDYASSILATEINAEIFLISTAVDRVYLDFGRPSQRPLDKTTVSELKNYLAQNQFPAGSMKPKIEAVINFLTSPDKTAIITSPENITKALKKLAGTHIHFE